MALKDKIYNYMQTNNLFEERVSTVVERVFKGVKSSKISRRKITDSLQELIVSGQIAIKQDKVVNNFKPLAGTFTRLANGNGKVRVVEKGGKVAEYFVPQSLSLNAGNNNKVNFVLADGRNGDKIAQVVNVQKLENELVFGVVAEKPSGKLVFVPDDPRFSKEIDISQNEFAKRALGKRCNIKLTYVDLNNPNDQPFGEISSDSQIYGFVDNPLANIASILDEAGVTVTFSESVNREASEVPTSVLEKDLVGRKDLRHLPFITIDPSTSKDMDDAVYIEKMEKNGLHYGYRLFVAIADVSHYVKQGSEIDKEALMRGTSIYPAGSVIPMLPEKLSNGICSLNPNVDRLAMVTEIEIGKNGVITGYNFHNAVINSKQKFSYEEVSALHHNTEEMLNKYSEYKTMVDDLYAMEQSIAKHSNKNGALRIQGYEPTIILSENKDKVVDFKNENYVDSKKIIERAMVANNTVVATFLNTLNVANILRGHEEPSEDKFNDLTAKLYEMGVDILGEPNNKTYQKMLSLIEDQGNISKVMFSQVVRSMKKANYITDPTVGHFALALENYTHFTSPIRRYVDLVEHRLIKKSMNLFKQVANKHGIDLEKQKVSDVINQVKHYATKQFEDLSDISDLDGKAMHLSDRELNANEISVKTDEVCGVLYMQDKVGETFSGFVSELNRDFMVVTLYDENDLDHSNIIDVKVPVNRFKKEQDVHAAKNNVALLDNSTNMPVYHLGDVINVKILQTDANTRMIYGEPELTKEHVRQAGR